MAKAWGEGWAHSELREPRGERRRMLKRKTISFKQVDVSYTFELIDKIGLSPSPSCSSLKMSWHRGYEFLEFWCWNLVPFLLDIGFQLLKSLWFSLTYFKFINAPNVLYRWKIWTAGRSIQHPDSSTMKPCCCNSCSMWFCIVLLKYTRPSLK